MITQKISSKLKKLAISISIGIDKFVIGLVLIIILFQKEQSFLQPNAHSNSLRSSGGADSYALVLLARPLHAFAKTEFRS